MKTIDELSSPAVLIEVDLMEANLRRMQVVCDEAGVELWPHVKTHKMVSVLRRQLELGAQGATCAKIGEAEELLPSGLKRLFIAHSLVDLRQAARLRNLHTQLDQLVLAVTSELHCDALEALLAEAKLEAPVLMAVDTGLHREGTRDEKQAAALAAKIRASSRMKLIGIYTHEGQAYGTGSVEEVALAVDRVHECLLAQVAAVGGELPLWPGCSVTAALMARQAGVKAVRPGSYVFGDLFLSEVTKVMGFDEAALSILATVLDRPEEGLALIDAGSKVFSSDKVGTKLFARAFDPRSLEVVRVSEEHGFLTGEGVDDLTLGQRIRFQPAHVCPVVNLASRVYFVRGEEVLEEVRVDARGRSD
ncbi:D-TA family PLP-dependent enzyme [soil metagenome]